MYKNKLNKIWNLVEKLKSDINISFILNFLDWTYQKIKTLLEDKVINKFPKRWEIWIAKLWMNIWSEQNWEILSNFVRPVLVIKQFWQKNDQIVILPLTKNEKPDYISVLLKNERYDFLKYKNSYILLDQIRTISKRRLIWNPLWKISNKDFLLVENKLKDLLFK